MRVCYNCRDERRMQEDQYSDMSANKHNTLTCKLKDPYKCLQAKVADGVQIFDKLSAHVRMGQVLLE